MVTNAKLTVYHKSLDATTHLEKWTRYNYDKVWFFGGKGAGIYKGYENANNVEVRIPYDKNPNVDMATFSVGDIIIKGELTLDIETQQDLVNYEIYNITSINNNDFGINQHLHIGGK